MFELFFTGSTVNSDFCLVYPNSAPYEYFPKQGPYSLNKQFTIDFFINPKYTTDKPYDDFTAGTILHHSSSYCVSLVTGSLRGQDGYKSGYRIMVQLSASADVPPRKVVIGDGIFDNFNNHRGTPEISGSATHQYVYLSKDNSLKRNHWHRVTIIWNGNGNRVGRILIDGKVDSKFRYNKASLSLQTTSDGMSTNRNTTYSEGRMALFIGNYYNAKHDQVRNFFQYYN